MRFSTIVSITDKLWLKTNAIKKKFKRVSSLLGQSVRVIFSRVIKLGIFRWIALRPFWWEWTLRWLAIQRVVAKWYLSMWSKGLFSNYSRYFNLVCSKQNNIDVEFNPFILRSWQSWLRNIKNRHPAKLHFTFFARKINTLIFIAEG